MLTDKQFEAIVEELEEEIEFEDLGEDETGGTVYSAYITERGKKRLREMIEGLNE